MTFIKDGLTSLMPLSGLVDGKPGAFSNAGGLIGGALLRKPIQNMIDGKRLDGSTPDKGNNGGEGLTPLSRRPRYGRGAAALSQDSTTGGL